MSSNEDELRVFNGLVEAAGLQVDEGSVEKDEGPDIRCCIAGQRYGFELTYATDQTVESRVRANPNAAMFFKNDVVAAVRKKLNMAYRFDIPVDLVVHEGLAPLAPTCSWIEDLQELISDRWDQSGF